MRTLVTFVSEIYIAYIGVIVLFLAAVGIYYLFKKPLYAFYMAVFTIPFKSLYLWIGGTNIELWKILSAVSLVLYGPSLVLTGYNRIKNNRYFHLLMFLVAYAILLTLIFMALIPASDRYTVEGGFFKNEGRFIYQISFFLITMNLVLWPVYILRNKEQLYNVFRIIVFSGIVLSALGIVQESSGGRMAGSSTILRGTIESNRLYGRITHHTGRRNATQDELSGRRTEASCDSPYCRLCCRAVAPAQRIKDNSP